MTDRNQTQQIMAKAENLREDLVAIAGSDLPFAADAERILEDMDEHQQEVEN